MLVWIYHNEQLWIWLYDLQYFLPASITLIQFGQSVWVHTTNLWLKCQEAIVGFKLLTEVMVLYAVVEELSESVIVRTLIKS